MRFGNPFTEEQKIQYQEAFRGYILVMNKELPQLPMYSNIYYDAYPKELVDFNTNPMWPFPYAIVKARFK